MDSTADVILTGQNPNDKFGVSVSRAGDVNNDGYSDVIIELIHLTIQQVLLIFLWWNQHG